MGICTQLRISSSWELEDIVTILKKHCNLTGKIKSCYKTSVNMSHINIKENKRMITVFTNQLNATGTYTLLDLGAGKEAIEMFTSIAEVIGGLLCKSDYEGLWEEFYGKLDDDDGLAYFIKYSVLNNECDGHSIKQLNASVKKWHDEMTDTNSDKNELFESESK